MDMQHRDLRIYMQRGLIWEDNNGNEKRFRQMEKAELKAQKKAAKALKSNK